MPAPDHMLEVGSGTHAQQTARVMERLEPLLVDNRPDLVIVPGDVNSTLAAALTAVKLGIPVAHLESGLRSYDRTMPEEINRIVTDAISDSSYVHSEEALDNLGLRGNPGRTGALRRQHDDRQPGRARGPVPAAGGLPASSGVEPGGYLLVTLHRPALVDGPLLFEAIAALNQVSAGDAGRSSRSTPGPGRCWPASAELAARNLHLVDPVGYLDFLSLEADAGAVLTDSGGIQEETTYLGVPCFTLRDNTERPVTIELGTNILLGLDPARIAEIPGDHRRQGSVRGSTEPPPLWDGQAAERIADLMADG